MKIIRLTLLSSLICIASVSFAQRITIIEQQIPVVKILEQLERQSGYTFFYNSSLTDLEPVKVSLREVDLEIALQRIFEGTGLKYSIVGKTVIIKPDDQEKEKSRSLAVRGSVTDKDGQPLPGVSVSALIGNQKKSWVTSADGTYVTSTIPENTVFTFSYIGFQSRKATVKGQRVLNITLQDDDNQLDEVQITAYNTTSRRLNTGNSFTLRAKDFSVSPASSILQMIQNKVPGLEITQQTGQVGSGFDVKIRGINGLNSVDPLYIIDGVSYPAGGRNLNPNGISGALPMLENDRAGSLIQLGGNALNYINPEDIASVDVLKDADATSIYGSRGAYGVILITTKKGSLENNGMPSLNVVLGSSVSTVGIFPRLLGTDQYLTLRREALRNDGLEIGPDDLDLNGTYPANAENDWSRELLDVKALGTRFYARYSGKQGRTGYSAATSFRSEQNVVRHNGSNKDGGVKLDFSTSSPNERFELDVSSLLNFTVNTMNPYDYTGDDAVFRAPNAPSYFNPDGTLNWVDDYNPYSYLNANYRGAIGNFLGSANLIFRPAKGLTFKTQLGYNLLDGEEQRMIPRSVFAPTDEDATSQTRSSNNRFDIRTWSVEPHISYQFGLFKKGTLSLTSGMTFQDKLVGQTVLASRGYDTDSRLNNPTLGAVVNNRFLKADSRYLGYFSNLNYNWSDKYIFSASMRYDGSTKFAPESRFGWFGSVGATYIFTEEEFIRKHLPFLSFGKLRGSYGTTGGDGIGNFQYLATYSKGPDYLGEGSFLVNRLANSGLRWEINKKRDISISLGFLQDRMIIDAGYYKNHASDILYGNPVASVTGFYNVLVNSPSSIENTGFEYSISIQNDKKKRLRWFASAVLTVPETKIVSIPSYYTTTAYNYSIGRSPINMKVYDYTGVDPQTGLYSFRKASGEITSEFLPLTNQDRTINIDLVPRYFGSVSNSLQYKALSLDFSVVFTDKMARTLIGQSYSVPGSMDNNLTESSSRWWQKPGDLADVPKPTTDIYGIFSALNFQGSSGAYQRIYYARLQNLSLSYNFTGKTLERLHAKSMRLSLQGQNLLTVTNYKDLDPEVIDVGMLPLRRTFNLQLGVSF